MGYSKEVFSLAKMRLDNIRNKNISAYEVRIRKFLLRSQEGAKVKSEIARNAVLVARAVLSGKSVKDQINALRYDNLKLREKLKAILRSSNLPEDYLDPKYSCNECLDTGYVKGKMCDCFKKILRDEAYSALSHLSPLPLSSFSTFNLDFYGEPYIEGNANYVRTKMQKIYNYSVVYADEFSTSSENLFMTGETGLGKTHLSLAIANVVIKKGFGVIYASVPNIVSKLEKEKFRYSSDENTQEHLTQCDLLILDDLGTEYRTQFSSSVIYNVINSRILYKKPTIISTNYSLKLIESDYSKRLVSRLWGNYRLLNFCGKDIRAEKAKIKAANEKNYYSKFSDSKKKVLTAVSN